MAVRRVQLRRGTTAQNNAFTGAVGEITVDTEKNTIHVHDGTAGGESLLRSDLSNNASIATDINFTNADRTVGSAMTTNDGNPTVLTLGGAGSTVAIAGNLTVTGNTTQTESLAVEARVIEIAEGAAAVADNNNDIGLFFTRSNSQDRGLFFFDEAFGGFKLGLDGNTLANTATDFDTDDANYTPASLSLGSLSVNDGNITNVGDIALDTISADGNTISMTLKEAGAGTAFRIIDDNVAGNGVDTFLTIDATDGADKLTISATSLDVSSVTSIDNAVVINESGADKDFRVEGSGKANALVVQGSDGFVGLNKAAPSVQLDVVGDTLITGSTTLEGAVVINDTGADVDFRVEGNTDANLLHVDASADAVGISTATPSKTLDVAGTFGVSSKATLAGSLDLTTASSDGITFRSEIAENGNDGDATLLRVNIGGTNGGGSPNYKAISWVAASDTFSLDGSAKILGGDVVLGSGTNATTISVVDQTAGGNTLGEHLTISAGKGQGTEAGGSIIFQTQSAAGGALTTVLTLDKANKATFTGGIDFSDGAVLGSSVGNNESMTLGGHTGSTVTTAGNLTVTSALTISGTGATALDFTNNNVTIGGTVGDTKTITLGGHAGSITKTAGLLTVGGNQIKDNSGDTVITFSNDANLTATFAGNIATTTTLTAGTDLTVSGGDITLGATDGGATTISVPTTDQGGAGHSLTLSSGVGSAGDGSNDGSLVLRTGATTVLTLDTAEKSTFAGDIDFSNGTTLGASVVNNQSMTLGGNAGSTVITSGHLRVTSGEIKAPDGNSTSITIDNDDKVTIGGNLQVTGNIIQNSQSETTITLDVDQNASIGNNLTVTGGLITLANGMSIDSTADGTLTLTEDVVATSAALKVGNGSIQNGGGVQAIALTNNNLTTTITGTTTVLSNNLQINGTSIVSEAAADALTLFNNNTGGITLGATTGTTTLGGSLTVTDNTINFGTDDDATIGGIVSTATKIITIGGGGITKTSGKLRLGGNVIQASDGAETISIDAANDLVTFLADIKVGGDTIQSSTADAIELSGANVAVKGDLTVEGQDLTLGTATAGHTTIQVPDQTAENTAGHTLTISAGAGKGDGAGGSLIFQTAPAGAEDAGAGTLATALTIDSTKKATFAGAVQITGNLEVDGTTTQIDSTISTYADPMIHLNKDALENSDLGVYMSVHANDNNHQNLAMYWDDEKSSFTFASTTADLGDGAGVVNLSGGANYRLEPVLAKALSLDGGAFTIDPTNSDFVISSAGAITSKNTATFDVDSTDALVVSTAAGADVLVVDTTNSHVETRHIMPLADSTYDLGTDALRFREGFFDTINVGSEGGVTNAGTNTFSNATPISITSAGTNGVTFRSDIADAGADGNATLLRVNIGGAGPAYKKVHWVAATDDFSVESGLISEGDFTVGSSKFVVTASTGATTLAGDLDLTKASPTIGASVGDTETLTLGGHTGVTVKSAGTFQAVGGFDFSTDADRTIGATLSDTTTLTLGGHAGSITKTAGHLTVGSDIIKNSEGTTTLTMDANEMLTVAGDLTVGGGKITLTNGATIDSETEDSLILTETTVVVDGNLTLNGTDFLADNAVEARNIFTTTTGTITLGAANSSVSLNGDLAVVGADVSLGANANGTATTLKTVARSGGADLAGNTLTVTAGQSTGTGAGGSLIFQTSVTGGASNANANALQDVLTLDTANLATFGGNIQINGTSIVSEVAADTLTLFSNNTGGITLGNSGAVTLGSAAGSTVVGNTLQINGASIVADVVGEARNIFATTTGNITIGGVGDVILGGDLTVTGNTIKSSTADAIQLSGANVAVNGTLDVTGITTLDDTLKIKASPTNSVGILFNSDSANADITLLKVNDTTANVQLDWDDSESSFVVKGGKIHSETEFTVGGTITSDPNFKVDASGNVTISGTLATDSSTGHVSFKDRVLSLASNSASASNDIGFYGLYKNDNDNEVEHYSGLVYQPISTAGNNGKLGVWKIFHAETIGANATNVTVEDTNLGVLDVSELRGGSALGNDDTAGADLTISGGKSTGSATGGAIEFKTGGSGADAAVENAQTLAMTINASQRVITAGDLAVGGQAVLDDSTITVANGSTEITVTKSFHKITPDAGNSTVTTIQGGETGAILVLMHSGANGATLTLTNDGTSDTAHALALDGGNITLADNSTATLIYNGNNWSLISKMINS